MSSPAAAEKAQSQIRARSCLDPRRTSSWLDLDPRRASSWLVLVAFFSVLTLLFTYPTWTAPDSVLNGLQDERFVAWILAWDAHALATKPLELFDANIFYPRANTLAYSEHMIATAVLVAPINWAGHPILAYNVALLLSFILTGIGTTLWVRHLTKSTIAGVAAGIIWTFAPAKFDQLPHLQMLSGQWIPFALWTCTLYLESGLARYALLCSGFVAIQFLACTYYGLILLPCLAVYALLLLLHLERPAGTLTWPKVSRDVAAMVLIFAILVAPFGLQYVRASAAEDFTYRLSVLEQYSAQPKSFVAPGTFNKAAYMEPLRRYRRAEANFFPGVAPSCMFLVALLWLLPFSYRGRWVGSKRDGQSGETSEPPSSSASPGDDTGAGSRSRHGPHRLRLWVHRLLLVLTLVAAIAHVSSLVVAQWWTRPASIEWVLPLSRTVHPSLWLPVFAGIAVALNPFGRGSGNGGKPSPRAVFVVVLSFLALATYLLAMGPNVRAWNFEVGHGPYWILYSLASPYQGLRGVGRFGLLWVLFVAALAGFALAAALERTGMNRGAAAFTDKTSGTRGTSVAGSTEDSPGGSVTRRSSKRGRGIMSLRTVLLALLLVTIVWEYRVWPLPAHAVRADEEPVYNWLAAQEDDFAVLHVPIIPRGEPWRETSRLLGSTLHWKNLVNGYSGHFPRALDRLARIPVFSEDFYSELRREYPIRYLLIHGPRVRYDFDEAIAPLLLADTENLEFVDHVGDVWVFRPRLDRDEGRAIKRTYPTRELRLSAGMELEARISPSASETGALLHAEWGGVSLQSRAISREWTTLFLEAPEGSQGKADGTTEIFLRPLVALGVTGFRAPLHLILDVQDARSGLGIASDWLLSTPALGYRVLRLNETGTKIETLREFPPTARGASELQAYVASIPRGEFVGVLAASETADRLPPDLVRALLGIGADLSVRTASGSKLAALGISGAPPGSALWNTGEDRAFVRVGPASSYLTIEVRNIRLLAAESP